MLIYYIILVTFGICTMLTFPSKENERIKPISQQREENRKFCVVKMCALMALILILVAGLRAYTVGYDTINYFEYFKFKQVYSDNVVYEPLYELINLIVIKAGLPFTFVLLICTTIVIFAFALVINRYSASASLSFFLLVALGIFGNSFNAVRQYLALAVFLISIRFIIDGKFVLYMLCCVVAFYFHSSAIVLFPVYFVRYIKLDLKFIIVSLFSMVTLAFCLGPIVKLVSKLTNFNYYERYFFNDEFKQPISLYYILYSTGMLVVFLLFYAFNKKKSSEMSKVDSKIFNMFLMFFYISVCIRIFGTYSGMFSLINRFSLYFFFSIIIIIPFLIKYVDGKYKSIILFLILILGVVYNVVSAVFRKSNGVYPYKMVINNIWAEILFYAIIILLTISSIVYAITIDRQKGCEINEQ